MGAALAWQARRGGSSSTLVHQAVPDVAVRPGQAEPTLVHGLSGRLVRQLGQVAKGFRGLGFKVFEGFRVLSACCWLARPSPLGHTRLPSVPPPQPHLAVISLLRAAARALVQVIKVLPEQVLLDQQLSRGGGGGGRQLVGRGSR